MNRPAVNRSRALAPCLVTVLGLSACLSSYPQRLPGPLVVPAPEGPAPEGAAPPEATIAAPSDDAGPRITVQRDSGPVWITKPRERGAYELPFYRKRERVPVGTLVRTGAGGRAELLWSPDATTLALFEEGRVTLGDPDRDEPVMRFHAVSRALLVLTPEDRVELTGGARLAGDPAEPTGTILLESKREKLLRVTNQSKLQATIAYRDEVLVLGPGESLDLPELANGTAPRADEAEPQRFDAHGMAIAFQGAVERRDEPAAVGLTAREAARVRALGVEVRLPPGETARFSGLTHASRVSTADANARP